jgi:hypothetical protein
MAGQSGQDGAQKGQKRAKKGKKAQRPIKSAINQQKGVVYKENTSIMLPCRNNPANQKKGLHYEKVTETKANC